MNENIYSGGAVVKLPESIDLNGLNERDAAVIRSYCLKTSDGVHEVYDRIQSQTIDLHQLDKNALSVLSYLCDQGFQEKILVQINGDIFIPEVSAAGTGILRRLVEDRKITSQVMDKLSSKKFSLSQLNADQAMLLEAIAWQRLSARVVALIEPSVTDENITQLEIFNLLITLRVIMGFENMSHLIPSKFSYQLIANPHAIDLANIIQPNDHHSQEILDNLAAQLRHPIEISMISRQDPTDGWPSMQQQVAEFPINQTKLRKGPGGWLATTVEKHGSDDTCYVQQDDSGKIRAVVFHNRGFDPENLEALWAASQAIPGYVSSSTYWERDEFPSTEKMMPRIRHSSLRELYYGPSLASINLNQIPQVISKEIFAQLTFIMMSLVEAGIHHGHPHEGNFNVRFLVIDETGDRRTSFDLKEVLNSLQQGSKAVPIVTLRDWDMAHLLYVN